MILCDFSECHAPELIFLGGSRSMTESNGVRILIHPQTDMPFPEEGGLSVPVGHEAVINMDVVSRLGEATFTLWSNTR